MEQRKTTVIEFKQQGTFQKVCIFAGISRASAYFKKKVQLVKRPGRSPPGFTVNRDGCVIEDHTVITLLKGYRSQLEFANGGGARKLSHYLAIEKK